MINFVFRAASTLENTSEQRTVHKFSANFTRRFISTVTLRSFHVPIPREFHSNFPDVLFPPRGGGRGAELEELTIFCVLNANVAGFT